VQHPEQPHEVTALIPPPTLAPSGGGGIVGGVETAFFFLAGLVCLAWVGYCVKKGRTYSGHLGWHTREEWPKLFWFELLFPAAIGLGMLVFSIKTLLGY